METQWDLSTVEFALVPEVKTVEPYLMIATRLLLLQSDHSEEQWARTLVLQLKFKYFNNTILM